jgi:hypothetical protein
VAILDLVAARRNRRRIVLIAAVTWFVVSQTGAGQQIHRQHGGGTHRRAGNTFAVQGRMFRTRDSIRNQLMAGTEPPL